MIPGRNYWNQFLSCIGSKVLPVDDGKIKKKQFYIGFFHFADQALI